MSRRLISFAVIMLSLSLLGQGCPGPGNDEGKPSTPDNNGAATVPSRSEVITILQEYRDALYPGLPATERQSVEAFVAGYPLEAPSGTQPIEVHSNNAASPTLTAVINRRDWAYAVKGVDYSFVGVFGQGQQDMFDVAFWCFLEASLLQPDETEHLANVAFHLNAREKHLDAKTLLLYARSVRPGSIPVLHNLAYAYACLGDYHAAITEQLDAVNRCPGVRFLLDRLAAYYELAGMSAEAAFIRNLRDGIDPGEWPVPEFPMGLSPAGLGVVAELMQLQGAMMSEMVTVQPPPVDDLDLLLQYADVNSTETSCTVSVRDQSLDRPLLEREQEICRTCNMPAAVNRYQLDMTAAGRAVTWARSYQRDASPIITRYLGLGMEHIYAASGLSATERVRLLDFWHAQVVTHENNLLHGTQAALTELRRIATEGPTQVMGSSCMPGVDIEIYHDPECDGIPFCGKFSVWFGVGSVQIDLPSGQIELTFGQGTQIKVGYNLKTKAPLVGLGYGFDLDGLAEVGAFATFDGEKGFSGVLDFGPHGPFALPGVGDTNVPLFNFGAMMN
ncbi:MAG: hypothetical protein GX616_16035 [Planctomycetes bacterium]|nr:hypothetical protein [Planctomycetota bacterium]